MSMKTVAATLSREAWPLGVAAATFTVAAGLPAGDPDMWWHLASGRWMVEHRDVLRVDVFSSTATGTPYALGQWLGEVVLYGAYAMGSWTGVAVLRGALVALAAFAVTRAALRFGPPPVAVPLAAAAILLSKPTWTDRPQLFTLAFFPLLLELLLAARDGPPRERSEPDREAERRRPLGRVGHRVGTGSRAALFATVPLLFAWSDLHGGYALGLVLVWLFAIEALIERRPAGALLAAASVATVVVSLNPGALSLLRAADHVVTATRGIVEESPVDPLTPFGALFALVLGGTLAALLRGGGSVLAALVLVPMLWLALSAQRHVPLFGFAAVPFVADAIWREATAANRRREADRVGVARAMVTRDRGPAIERRATTVRRRPPSAALIATALWVGAVASLATADARPDLRPYPAAAIEPLRASSGVLLNEYDWGGFLIWTVPERPVFVDGRLFPFIADDVLAGYREAIALLPRWRPVLERRNVAQVLLRPDRPLAGALREDGWAVRSEGEGYVLLERPR